jgi:hypothetical protein
MTFKQYKRICSCVARVDSNKMTACDASFSVTLLIHCSCSSSNKQSTAIEQTYLRRFCWHDEYLIRCAWKLTTTTTKKKICHAYMWIYSRHMKLSRLLRMSRNFDLANSDRATSFLLEKSWTIHTHTRQRSIEAGHEFVELIIINCKSNEKNWAKPSCALVVNNTREDCRGLAVNNRLNDDA